MMAEHDKPPVPGAHAPIGGSNLGSPAHRRGRVGSSVGVVVAGLDPQSAAALVADVHDLLPAATRKEFLVLDDHISPQRRDLVSALDGVGDAMRLVPMPNGGPSVELDALAVSCGSEFLLLPIGENPPLSAVEPLLESMWSRGSDAGVALASPTIASPTMDSPTIDRADVPGSFTAYAALSSAEPALGSRVVVVRRWVARWVFSETDRALDPASEVADRARLLGLEMVVVDATGSPLN